jgi:hypothetical protein
MQDSLYNYVQQLVCLYSNRGVFIRVQYHSLRTGVGYCEFALSAATGKQTHFMQAFLTSQLPGFPESNDL